MHKHWKKHGYPSSHTVSQAEGDGVHLTLLVGHDLHVRLACAGAQQQEACILLLILEKEVCAVDLSRQQARGAGTACACPAQVGHLHTSSQGTLQGSDDKNSNSATAGISYAHGVQLGSLWVRD